MSDFKQHPDEFLPWYVNGTLTGPERNEVERHLQDCDHCQKEVEFLAKLRTEIKTVERFDVPGEFGLKRLLRDVKKTAASEVRTWAWWQPTLAAAAMVIVIQGILVVNMWPHPEPFTPAGVQYDGVILQLTFAPETTEMEIRKALIEANGALVGGPSPMGVYRMRLNVEPEEEKKINAIVAALQARTSIVTHVVRE
ncbi:MAG: zf-HC2 domain-containing protein [Acidiferrobacterales bacterium]